MLDIADGMHPSKPCHAPKTENGVRFTQSRITGTGCRSYPVQPHIADHPAQLLGWQVMLRLSRSHGRPYAH